MGRWTKSKGALSRHAFESSLPEMDFQLFGKAIFVVKTKVQTLFGQSTQEVRKGATMTPLLSPRSSGKTNCSAAVSFARCRRGRCLLQAFWTPRRRDFFLTPRAWRTWVNFSNSTSHDPFFTPNGLVYVGNRPPTTEKNISGWGSIIVHSDGTWALRQHAGPTPAHSLC